MTENQREAMVVCPQPLAGEVGRDVLRRGGNAVDAAVATAFCQGVVDPQMCGLGGAGVMLHYSAAERRTEALEFYARAGGAVRPDQWEHLFIREAGDRYGYVLQGSVNDAGYQAVGVPGTVAGLGEALERWGTISLDQAIAPAVPVARDGFQVTGNTYNGWVATDGPDDVPTRKRMAWTAESKRLYTKDGEFYGLGERLRNEDYARTLERLARAGWRDFYEGEIAAAIAEDFARNGGFVSAEDLRGYRTRLSEPVRGSYRGLEVVAAGPPAGGMTLLQLLNYLEGLDLRAMGWPSSEAALARVRAMGFAFGDRERYLADPEFVDVPVERLTEKAYAAAVREAHDSPTTTQVTVVDRNGDAVSMTHTLGSSSGVITPGLGFTYNNYMNCFDPRPGRANSLAPGKTRITMITPAFCFTAGRLRYAIGAPGGTRIVGGVLQTLLNLVDHEMDPEAAVAAPRVDFQGEAVAAEQRISEDVLGPLRVAGYAVNRRSLSYDAYFSRVQLIQVEAGGRLVGASDPRKDGGIALRA
ncbi:MAG: gamma-glutamyltransferase family protein [Candidatus Dormibacteraceae bacterium]